MATDLDQVQVTVTVSHQERERRYRAVYDAMSNSGIDVLIISGNAEATQRGYIRYLSDWRLWGGNGYMIITPEAPATLILGSGSQAYWARQIGWVTDVRSTLDKIDEILVMLRAYAPHRVGIVGLTSIIPYSDVKRLQNGLTGTEIIDATSLMNTIMAVKSAEEITHIRDTYSLVAKALELLRANLAPGLTELDVIGDVIGFLAQQGCLDGIAHISNQAPPFIRPPTNRCIDKHDIVKVSLEFAGSSGHWIELSAIHSFGNVPEREYRIFETTCKAVDTAIPMLKPGVRIGDLSKLIETTFREDGWELAGRAIWDIHGIGMNVIEPPIGLPENSELLRENMVLNIHPGWLVTSDQWGVYVQNNVLVTPNGGEVLGDYRYSWHVLEI